MRGTRGPYRGMLVGLLLLALLLLNLGPASHLLQAAPPAGRALQGESCAASLKLQFNCKEEGCADLQVGYLNYMHLLYCDITAPAPRVLMCLVLVAWVLFLLHIVETTTNDYFVTSLQVAVRALELSPNVAGVTFLAVGNAACDVIASIAAITVGKNDVGVGTTVGAGIFVTCAVVAAVAFVSDVRLPRRSFIRDVAFCLFTVCYLVYCANDNYITLGEAIGFMVIYVVFVLAVGGGRILRGLYCFNSVAEAFEDEVEEPTGAKGGGEAQAQAKAQALPLAGAPSGDPLDKQPQQQQPSDPTAAAQAQALDAALVDQLCAEIEAISGVGRERVPSDVAASLGLLGSSGGSGSGSGDAFGSYSSLSASSGPSASASSAFGAKSFLRRENTVAAIARHPPARDSPSPGRRARDSQALAMRGLGREDSVLGLIGDLALSIVEPQDPPPPAPRARGRSVEGWSASFTSSKPAAWARPASLSVSAAAASRRAAAAGEQQQRPASAAQAPQQSFMGIVRQGSVLLDRSALVMAPVAVPAPPSVAGPGRWTASISNSSKYTPGTLPTYHKRRVMASLTAAWVARGLFGHAAAQRSSKYPPPWVRNSEGKWVHCADLALKDPAAAAAVLLAAAQRLAQAGGGGAFDSSSSSTSTSSEGSEGSGTSCKGISACLSALYAPFSTFLLRPCAQAYLTLASAMGCIGPYYTGTMQTLEAPLVLLRNLTIPMLQPGEYRRTLAVLNPPCAFAFVAIIATTAIVKEEGGVPIVEKLPLYVWAFLGGLPVAALLHLFALPTLLTGTAAAAAMVERGETLGLLGASAASASAAAAAAAAVHGSGGEEGSKGQEAQGNEGGGAAAAAANHHNLPAHLVTLYGWGFSALGGGTRHPPPSGGPLLCFYLVLSFVLALFWLLVIANELVGTALAFGKILRIPDVVMGLGILAVGNSVNDFAASIAIARDGFAQMAIAGAYAGPMFNILAGIGLPFLIKIVGDGGRKQRCGGESPGAGTLLGSPILWMSYFHLIIALTVTIIWVPLLDFRITKSIGYFLTAWFFFFLLVLFILAVTPGVPLSE